MVSSIMGDSADARRYLENWQDEVDSAAEYRAMSASEPDPRLAKVYANLAAMEEGHIGFWEDRLRRVGAKVPPLRASWRSRVLAAIARRLGPDLVLATIAAKETVDQNSYLKQPETAGTAMPGHERWHAKVLQQLVSSQPRGLQGASSAASRAGIDRSAATRCAPRSSAPTTGSARISAWSWAWSARRWCCGSSTSARTPRRTWSSSSR